MAITKSHTINARRAEVTINRHVGNGPDSITFNISASNHGFSASLHLTVGDAQSILSALIDTLGGE